MYLLSNNYIKFIKKYVNLPSNSWNERQYFSYYLYWYEYRDTFRNFWCWWWIFNDTTINFFRDTSSCSCWFWSSARFSNFSFRFYCSLEKKKCWYKDGYIPFNRRFNWLHSWCKYFQLSKKLWANRFSYSVIISFLFRFYWF